MSSAAHAPGNRARFSFEEAAAACGGQWHGAAPREIVGIETDTRRLSPGALFVALRGERFDGHDFLATAQENGAAAALVSDLANAPADLPLLLVSDTLLALGDLARAHRQRFAIPVVGVTGSYGKTTTRALIAAALSPRYEVLATEGNFNNEIGVPLTLLRLEEKHSAAVVELAMRGAGQIEYLAKIALPTLALITNIGPQHIELLGSVENVARAKAEVLPFLPEDGVAVLPADDEFLAFLCNQVRGDVVTFGSDPAADFRCCAVQNSAEGGVKFSLTTSDDGRTRHFALPLPGAHNAVNAAAALAIADCLEVPLDEAGYALESVNVPGARMRVVQTAQWTLIDDSYNAGPSSMRAALQTLLDFPSSGRRVAVLGAMKELGEFTEAEHRKIGDFSGTFVELLVGVGGETRPLLDAALASARRNECEVQLVYCENAAEAAARLRELAASGDVILIKGSRSVGLETVVNELANGA